MTYVCLCSLRTALRAAVGGCGLQTSARGVFSRGALLFAAVLFARPVTHASSRAYHFCTLRALFMPRRRCAGAHAARCCAAMKRAYNELINIMRAVTLRSGGMRGSCPSALYQRNALFSYIRRKHA